MFVRNFRKTMIALIAVGCCAVIFRWNPFFKDVHQRSSDRSLISSEYCSEPAELSSNNISLEGSLLSAPDDELLEPPVFYTEEESAGIRNLPELKDLVSREPMGRAASSQSPIQALEEPPSNLQSELKENTTAVKSLSDEKLGALLSEVSTPLKKDDPIEPKLARNPHVVDDAAVEGKSGVSLQVAPSTDGPLASGFRPQTSGPQDPGTSNQDWASNPFIQNKLEGSKGNATDSQSYLNNGQGIPSLFDDNQPDGNQPEIPETGRLLNTIHTPGLEHSSSEISPPRVSNTNFVANVDSRPRVGDNPYIAVVPPNAPARGGLISSTPSNQIQAAEASSANSPRPHVLHGAENFVMAAEPQKGDHWKSETPIVDQRAVIIEPILSDFSPTPTGECDPYDPYQQQDIYQNKKLNANQRPIIEWGRPWYQLGQLSPGSNILGSHNPVAPQFLVFGDIRSAVASNSQNGNSSTLLAFQTNLNFDLQITSTERFHMFMSPLTEGLESTGLDFDDGRFINNTNANILTGFFEGDMGAIVGGATNKTLPFDLPFAFGVMPLLFQNGIWMEDQILGVAVTIPARNSPRFDISNMEFTFFAGYDKVVSDAFPGDDSAGKVYGIASFLEAFNGYLEADYAFVEDRTFLDRSYHNFGVGFTRRFGRFVSNSTRAIVNLGQQPDGIAQTADGWLLLSENSLITGAPSTVVPYFNMFAGFDRPQSVARAVQAGGVLRNTGILFESDNLTGYPTLDATANQTFGSALGLNLLASDFSQQLIVETAFLNTMGNDADRNAPGNQYGMGVRYQLPLTNALIFRTDAMYGFLDNTDDIHGFRVELRHKY